MKITAFCNIRIEVSFLISPDLVRRIRTIFGIKYIKLDKPIQFADYRQQTAGIIEYKIQMNFEIDNRRFPNQDFFIIETGYDIFIGLEWLVKQNIWLYPRSRIFYWFDITASDIQSSRIIIIPKKKPQIDEQIQKYATQQDQLFDLFNNRIRIADILKMPFWRSDPSSEKISSEIPFEAFAADRRMIAALIVQFEDDLY